MKWEILGKGNDVIKILLKNRNILSKKEINEFLNPKKVEEIRIQELGIKISDIKKILTRLEIARSKKEKIVIFGDYDCDGVCATAILWETLYKLGFDALPHIPDRFTEGYGLKKESIQRLKAKDQRLNLIITVDNGIVAHEAIKEAKKGGIDVIVVDHHAISSKPLKAYGILHSTMVCGSALSWFLARELSFRFGIGKADFESDTGYGLDLVALGTIADQMPLLNINRSLVKFGLESLKKTNRKGLKALINNADIKNIGVYEIGFIIAPRINAMGRLSHALDSLRLVCTRDPKKASDLAKVLSETNIERQRIVEKVLDQVLKQVQDTNNKLIIVDGNYHEGVIGLASGKITEKLYRPSIVISKGAKISKASARSISGFNIVEAVKETGLILEGGGHPMAAGFSIETKKIEEFKIRINELNKEKLTDVILEKKLKIDLELHFSEINIKLVKELQQFEPTGYGNFQPVFMSSKVKIMEAKAVGSDSKHLKLKLSQDKTVFDAIWFNSSITYNLLPNTLVDIAYTIETNIWNGRSQIQLKIKDIKVI